ncbi:MAG: hypothetical protein IKE53_05680 [Clostridiales bacterium]|nr:hypothetical protein [Clostridiales bacterium]
MRICKYCGCRFEENEGACPNCGSTGFQHVCPGCGNSFDGAFCNECGVRFDAIAKTCPECGKVYYTNACPECGYEPIKAAIDMTAQANPRPARKSIQPDMMPLMLTLVGICTGFFPISLVGMVLAIKEEKAGRGNAKTTAAKWVAIVYIALEVLMVLLFFIIGVMRALKN